MATYYSNITKTSLGVTEYQFEYSFVQTFGSNDIYGRDSRDSLFGRHLFGIQFSDRIHARGGDDTVIAGLGDDTVYGGSGNDQIWDLASGTSSSQSGNDLFHGGTGNDLLHGNMGADTLCGDEDQDSLFGGDGDDVLIGGTGVDYMNGGGGADCYHVDNAADVIVEAAGGGEDTVTTRVSYTLASNVEHVKVDKEATVGLVLKGNALGNVMGGGRFGDTMFGLGGDDVLNGMDGADSLNGGEGSDWVEGGVGADRIDGGAGADILIGGKDADVFVFSGEDVSTALNHTADAIRAGGGAIAFERGRDKIDLSAIDADLTTAGDQAFVTTGFLFRYGRLTLAEQGDMTQVLCSVDGDTDVEFAILIEDGAVRYTEYTAADFIL